MVTRKFRRWREILFLTIPPAVYLVVAMSSHMNIGVRHILPAYPFLIILVAGAAVQLMALNPRWKFAVIALLIWQVITVVP